MAPTRSDEAFPETTARFGKPVRVLALFVVIALILLTLVPVLVRVARPGPSSPTTTQPGIVAFDWYDLRFEEGGSDRLELAAGLL